MSVVSSTGDVTGYRCVCGQWVPYGTTTVPHSQVCPGPPRPLPYQSIVTHQWNVDERVLALLERIADALEGRQS